MKAPRQTPALTSHLLDGYGTRQGPQVRVADPRVLGLDGLQQLAGQVQASVGTPLGLWGEPDGVEGEGGGLLMGCKG
jgi:hypothetical protein